MDGKKTIRVIPHRFQRPTGAAGQRQQQVSDDTVPVLPCLSLTDGRRRSGRAPEVASNIEVTGALAGAASRAPPVKAKGDALEYARNLIMSHVAAWKPHELLQAADQNMDKLLSVRERDTYRVPKNEFGSYSEYLDYFVPLVLMDLRAAAAASIQASISAGFLTASEPLFRTAAANKVNKRDAAGIERVLVTSSTDIPKDDRWRCVVQVKRYGSGEKQVKIQKWDLVAVWPLEDTGAELGRKGNRAPECAGGIPVSAVVGVVIRASEYAEGWTCEIRVASASATTAVTLDQAGDAVPDHDSGERTDGTAKADVVDLTLDDKVGIVSQEAQFRAENLRTNPATKAPVAREPGEIVIGPGGIELPAKEKKLKQEQKLKRKRERERAEKEAEASRKDKKRKEHAEHKRRKDDVEEKKIEEGEEQEWALVRLGSIVTYQREVAAVYSIRDAPLLQAILRPGAKGMETEQDRGILQYKFGLIPKVMEHYALNESQRAAVSDAVTLEKGFSVIQGPPGTGKTKTLVALLNASHLYFYQQHYDLVLAHARSLVTAQGTLDLNRTGHARFPHKRRILVCAPSNAAVDEILFRVKMGGFVDGFSKRYDPPLCRVGMGDRISASSQHLTAEKQAETFFSRIDEEVEKMRRSLEDTKDTLRKGFITAKLRAINDEATRLRQLLLELPMNSQNDGKVISIHTDYEKLQSKCLRYCIAMDDKLSHEERVRAVARCLANDAELVFATLSGAAHLFALGPRALQYQGLTPLFGVEQSPHIDGGVFDAVIIDEAAQATETSSLIPVSLGASRCVLVGDPQQLTATVLGTGMSAVAYSLSLLERKCLAGKVPLMLKQQYRMHPSISLFPRKHFYKSELADDESVLTDRDAPYHNTAFKERFGPYLFMDIRMGGEEQSRKSLVNRTEAHVAALLYKNIRSACPTCELFTTTAASSVVSQSRFGVVTPYKGQQDILRAEFNSVGANDIEIDTVDAYQGREKDFMIFSCVRSNAKSGSIGFVRDIRRMNVGITRAKYSLIIMGNAQSLMAGSKDWRALIEDARERGLVLRVDSPQRAISKGRIPKATYLNDPVDASQRKKKVDSETSKTASAQSAAYERVTGAALSDEGPFLVASKPRTTRKESEKNQKSGAAEPGTGSRPQQEVGHEQMHRQSSAVASISAVPQPFPQQQAHGLGPLQSRPHPLSQLHPAPPGAAPTELPAIVDLKAALSHAVATGSLARDIGMLSQRAQMLGVPQEVFMEMINRAAQDYTLRNRTAPIAPILNGAPNELPFSQPLPPHGRPHIAPVYPPPVQSATEAAVFQRMPFSSMPLQGAPMPHTQWPGSSDPRPSRAQLRKN
ncbi:putative ATP-dependent helicase [Porphyridium purpureum]|uniref:Putative ATP-dependent helicase n=1 Tax=Porphyridium purpureum TaxID=35688 RepID=A0A5J4YS92_PORPP|nr:putative ATP-dependent helicase [Porphyridium purpureum]|eukprot:POR6208..scf236_6